MSDRTGDFVPLAHDEIVITLATSISPVVLGLLEQAQSSLINKRGGDELLAAIVADAPATEVLERFVRDRELWIANVGLDHLGLAIVRDEVIVAVYVAPHHRRHGIARALVQTVLSGVGAPRDGYALPGDRATKSLYESMGWKARLLTMRGE